MALASHCWNISSILALIGSSLESMARQWAETQRCISRAVASLEETLGRFGADGDAAADLASALACGAMSEALQQWLATAADEPAVRKLDKAIEQGCAALQAHLGETIQRSIEALIFRLSEMVGLARYRECFDELGLRDEALQCLLRDAMALDARKEELYMQVRHVVCPRRACCLWHAG